MDAGRLSNADCTWPLIRSVTSGAEPRYGTCCMLTPALNLKSSPATCEVEPVPNDASVILPGLALASAINSGTELAATDGCTSSTSGERTTPETIAMSRRVAGGDREQRVAVGRRAHDGCSTGRSLGFAPRRILSTYTPQRGEKGLAGLLHKTSVPPPQCVPEFRAWLA